MIGRKWKIGPLISVGVMSVVFALIGSGKVFASNYTSLGEGLVDKAVFQGVNKCYNGYEKTDDTNATQRFKSVNSSIKLSDYNKFGDIMTKTASKHKIAFVTGLDPSFNGGKYRQWSGTKNGIISCQNLFVGNNSTDAALPNAYNKQVPNTNSVEDVTNFLDNMGFQKKNVTGNGSETCYSVHYQIHSQGMDASVDISDPSYNPGTVLRDHEGDTNSVCMTEDGKVIVEEPKEPDELHDYVVFRKYQYGDDSICLDYHQLNAVWITKITPPEGCVQLPSAADFTPEWVMNAAEKMCRESIEGCHISKEGEILTGVRFSLGNGQSTASKDKIKMSWSGSADKASIRAIQFLSGSEKYNSKDDLKVTRLEKRLLYQYYLEQYYGVDLICPAGEVELAKKNGNVLDWLDESKGEMVKCEYSLKNAKNKDKPVNGISKNGYFQKKSIKNLDALIKAFDSLDKSYTPEELGELDDLMAVSSGSDIGDGEVSTCAGAGGSGSLGWIVCPIMEWLSNASEGIYNDSVEPNLQISPELFSGEGHATAEAWGNFRDMANVLFVVIFLAVIFSQLTGVGIDNYGIKKILPKLIVIAILINLSYILSLLAVDISNIIGNGLYSLFQSMKKEVNNYTLTLNTGNVATKIAATGLTGLGLLAALAVGGVAIWANPAVLLSLLVAAIGIFISIIFLFVLLAARKAAIVAMVVMSPVIVVMYALPNTKKLFDKWLKLFEGLLLVFPISGLLVGAGDYVSSLLVAAGNGQQGFMYAFTAMAVSIVPVLFIPTVLRGAFSAMGRIGTGLAGLGDRMRSGATRGIRNSETFKNAQERSRERGTMRKAGIVRNADGSYSQRELSGFGSFIRGGNHNIARNRSRFLEDEKNRRRGNMMMGAGFENALAGMEAGLQNEATDQALSLMQRQGIWMTDDDGNRTNENPVAFTLNNATERMDQLERISRKRALNSGEMQEMRALTRGMVGMKGGGGRLGKIIREAGAERDDNGRIKRDNDGNALTLGTNKTFMDAIGQIYSQDSAVKSKLDEKDVGAAAYTETYMPGNGGTGGFGDFKYELDSNGQSVMKDDYKNVISEKGRIKSYAAGLNQGGIGMREYVDSLSEDDIKAIAEDERLMSSSTIDIDAQKAVKQRYDQLFGGTSAPAPTPAPAPIPAPAPTPTPGAATGGGPTIITGDAAEAAFKEGRRSGEIILPH